MIHVSPEAITRMPGFEQAYKQAALATERLSTEKGPLRRDAINSTAWMKFKPLVRRAFHGKCAYCESPTTAIAFGDLDHYRPKSLYPWLAYDWQNLLFSCQICAVRYKAAQFPTENSAATEPADLPKEQPLLLNPYFDFPENHLTFRVDDQATGVVAVGLTKRGNTSIVVLGLNREELARTRYERWQTLRMMLEIVDTVPANSKIEINTRIIEALKSEAPLAGAMRALCRNHIEKNGAPKALAKQLDALAPKSILTSPKELAAAEKEASSFRDSIGDYSVENPTGTALEKFAFGVKRVERIEVKNLRAIRDALFTFPAKGDRESWLMLIGENGVGKSSLLQGVALALMGQEHANNLGLNGADFVRHGAKHGFVRVHLNAIGPVELRFSSGTAKFEVSPPDPKVPLLAYGTTRLLPRDVHGRQALKNLSIRAGNLFDPTIPLCDAEEWLRKAWDTDHAAFANVGRALCRLLLLDEKKLPRVTSKGVEIKLPDGWRPIRQLSDGYKSILALVVDIAIGTSGTLQKPEEAVGFAILDEIELHLHPQWKISIVERFRQVFPRMSFLTTTHDPLCLKGLGDHEIVVLHRNRRGVVKTADHMPSVEPLKTDDILMSELFGLESSRGTAAAVTIARFSALNDRPQRTRSEEAEYQALREKMAAMLAGAITPLQRDVERVLAAAMRHLRNGTTRSRLPIAIAAEMRRQVQAIGLAK